MLLNVALSNATILDYHLKCAPSALARQKYNFFCSVLKNAVALPLQFIHIQKTKLGPIFYWSWKQIFAVSNILMPKLGHFVTVNQVSCAEKRSSYRWWLQGARIIQHFTIVICYVPLFVTVSHYQPNLINYHLRGSTLELNIRVDWKWLTVTNTLAYFGTQSVRMFIV